MRESRTDFLSTAARIAVLERQLRSQGRIIWYVLAAVFLAFVVGFGPGGFEEIKARRFVVSDEEDNPRALLTSHQGTTVLSLFDSDGRPRARFSVLNDGHPEITLLDQSGRGLIQLAENNGTVRLSMNDGGGVGSIVLGQSDKQFGIDVSDARGDSGIRLRSLSGQPQLTIVGPKGGGGVQVFAHADKSGVSISDSKGHPGAILSMLENLRPILLLQGQQKRTLVLPQETIPGRQGNVPDQR